MRRTFATCLFLVLAVASCGKKRSLGDVGTEPVSRPQAGVKYASVEIKGTFSARAELDINTINADMRSVPKEPPPLVVTEEQLRFLNHELPAAVDDIVKEAGFTRVKPDESSGVPLHKLVREPEGDQFFGLRVEASAENGLGGHYGGLDVMTVLKPLQREEDLHLYNHGHATVVVGTPEEMAKSLRAAVRRALSESRSDLEAALHRPIGDVTLMFETASLTADQRKSVPEIARCAAAIAHPVEQTPGEASDARVTRKLAFRRWNAEQTEQDWLFNYEQALPQLAQTDAAHEHACFDRTPLAGRGVLVKRDDHTFTITFTEHR